MPSNRPVGSRFLRTLGSSEVDDVAVALEHVNLLDSLDGLDVDLLQGLLKLLVIGTGPSGSSLDLSPGVPLPLSSYVKRQNQNSEYSVLSDGVGEESVVTYPAKTEALVSLSALH